MDFETREKIRRRVEEIGPDVEFHQNTDQMASAPKWGNRRLPRIRNILKRIQPQIESIKARAEKLNQEQELHLRDTILMRLEALQGITNQAQLDRALKALEQLLGVAAEKQVVEIHQSQKDLSTKEAVIEAIRNSRTQEG